MTGLPELKIEVSGPEHSGKTALIAVLSQVLRDLGMDVVLQRADEQLDRKLEDLDRSKERIVGERVFVREMQTAR